MHQTDLTGLTVCVVACHYQPETTGSAPYNTALINALSDAGADVHAVVGIPHYPQWSVQDPRYVRGIRWSETDGAVKVTRVRHAVPSTANLAGRARMESSFSALAAPHVLASRSDIVIAVTPLLGALLAGVAGRRSRPLGVVVHDLSGNAAQQSGTTGGRAAKAVSSAEYRLARSADLIGIITPRFRDVLVGAGGVDTSRIVDLPIFSHVATADLSPHDARVKLGWPTDDRFTVVHTGNMGMKQGLESVVEAARLAESSDAAVDFVLVGDGNQRQALVDEGSSIRNLRFVDPVDEDDYPTVLAAADALLLNERAGVHEMSLPSKVTSYVTARRPIIAATEPGGITCSVLEKFDAARLCAPGSGAELLSAALDLAAHESERTALTARAAELGRAEFSEAAGVAGFARFARSVAQAR
ncbi:glycosyltransferase WbuB [Rhodococcoides trifolii]|uniref:Glycosyltransferase WbuB n=1 Tax=Rhodococcoides trifolii TaxID=908250 RepID=A0A917LIT3_9NOCA|nr:glycosyltransferase family 4 protein [Rhodococcus trifolii]GGG27970.1 glycosyltransferase WbuB [Rhodococcus trifolii]